MSRLAGSSELGGLVQIIDQNFETNFLDGPKVNDKSYAYVVNKCCVKLEAGVT